ncbi:hypothetical protein BGX38DRAFT_340231 [Terfezia claveryi]|nr:hypothetical protein BGX38DRAFT_340231 [Terfezia claveryi]
MSAPSLVGLNSHHAYDLRTRAITYMLAALEATSSDARTTLKPNPVILKNEAELYASPQGSNHLNSANQANSDRLKFLNQVALLLVREYEIVAVLPKRSGSQAHVNVMVTTDSDSDLDELNTGDLVQDASRPSPRIKYLVTRNPRNDSPSGKSSNASANTVEVLHALEQVTSLPNMYEYLVKYRDMSPFPTTSPALNIS